MAAAIAACPFLAGVRAWTGTFAGIARLAAICRLLAMGQADF